MKNINILFTIILAASIFVSCEKEYEDPVRITYFPDFVVEGPSIIFNELGATYVDSSVTATEDGENLEVTLSVRGKMTGYSGTEVDHTTADIYSLTYSATNSDGYNGTASRTVLVNALNSDLVSGIEGIYKSSVQRGPSFTASAQYTDMVYILITKTGSNTYAISDALAGYYDIGRNYGYDYAAQGAVITANDIASNDFSISQAVFPIWGNTVDITEFKVSPANKSITFTGTGNFGNGTFHIQLTQVEF